jgi:A/G-specific adenine glycosylase
MSKRQIPGRPAGRAKRPESVLSVSRRSEAALSELAHWFARHQRVLPWRDEPTLYRVWISEIMLQQTQVATVVPYFEKFTARFPTVQSLAQASQDDVLAHWAGLGYYSRARNLHRAAQEIVAHGDFPRTRDGWLEIPGVGGYTAGAILSIALNQPEAILDGNVERVLSRLRKVARTRGDAAYKERLWRLSRMVVERAHALGLAPRVINQALMEIGATTCTPRKPRCELCPLKAICRAQAAGDAESYPPRKKPKQWLKVDEELHCVLDGQGRVLVVKRAPGEWRAGLWDLPRQTDFGSKELESLGTVETRYVVTRHKVSRVARVWRLKKAPSRLRAAESDADTANTRWVSLSQPEVAGGAPLKRTLQLVRERFDR